MNYTENCDCPIAQPLDNAFKVSIYQTGTGRCVINSERSDSGAFVPPTLQQRLVNALRGGRPITDGHIKALVSNNEVEGTKTKVHLYAPQLDGHGRLKPDDLVSFLINQVIAYAIPRGLIEKAKAEFIATDNPSVFSALDSRARSLFTNLQNTGEGGELLLFALAERVFGLTQILCKMSLKTSTPMHYHGADGVYACADEDDWLDIYWGESKLYKDPIDAIRDCLASLAPFLRDEWGDQTSAAQDIFLVNEYANLTDPETVAILKTFLDRDDPNRNKVKMCGFALVGYDSSAIPEKGATAIVQDMEAALLNELPRLKKQVGKRSVDEIIQGFDIHFILVPFRSVEEFRKKFIAGLGK